MPTDAVSEFQLGGLPCRIHLPADSLTPPALLYLHGETRDFGDMNSWDGTCSKLAAEARCAVVSVRCRREPGRSSPAPFEDAIGAWTALVEKASSLNIDPARLGIAGDGTGASLAAAVASACRSGDRALRPRLQILLHPVEWRAGTKAPGSETAPDRSLNAAITRGSVDARAPDVAVLAGGEAPRRSAEDLAPLPATFILTVGRESLIGEGLAHAAPLADACNELTHVHVAERIRGLSTQSRLAPASDSVLALAAAFVRKHLRRSAGPAPMPSAATRDR